MSEVRERLIAKSDSTSFIRESTIIGANINYWCAVFLAVLLLMQGGGIKAYANTTDEKKKTVTPEETVAAMCNVAKDFESAGYFKKAADKYQAILEDKDLIKQDVDLKCASNGFIEATKKQLQERCEKAAKQLNAIPPLPSDAERLYGDIVNDKMATSEELSCAKEGLLKVAQYYVAVGKNLEKDEYLNEAEDMYKAAIKASADYLIAYNKLADLTHKKKKRYLQALSDLGFENEALAEIKKALTEDPTIDVHGEIIDYITRPRVPLWKYVRDAKIEEMPPRWFWRKLPHVLKMMPIIEALILFLIIWLASRKFLWGSPTLDIKDFSTDATEKEKCTKVCTMIEHSLIDLTKSARANREALMISGPITPVTIELGGMLSPSWQSWMQALNKLLTWLFVRRSLAVTGYVYDATKKKGIAIQLESGSRILAKHIIWADDFYLPSSTATEPWDALADCAAIWTIFALRQRPIPHLPRFWAFLKRKVGSPRKILGTQYWESYAWFFLADKQYTQGQLENAERAYLKALNLDPSFAASRVNLAGIYHSLGDKGPGLKAAIDQLMHVQPTDWQRWFGITDPSLYTGSFRRAAIYFDLSAKEEKEKNIKNAIEATDELISWIKNSLRFRPLNRDLKKYLEWRKSIVECMKIGLIAADLKQQAEPMQQNKDVKNMTKELESVTRILASKADFYSLYNLACTYSLFCAMDPKVYENYCTKSLDYLGKSLELTAIMENVAKVKQRAKRATEDAAFQYISAKEEFKKITKMGEDLMSRCGEEDW